MADLVSPRPRGRPRSPSVDAAILRATIELLTESGVGGTSLAAVARRARVSRATVYLRWPTRSSLIGAAARSAVGGQLLPLTGDVAHDVREAASFIQRIFQLGAFPALLTEIVAGVLADPPGLSFDQVAPRRREFGRLYSEHAGAGGFETGVDPHLAFDMVLGTSIAYLMANGRPMSIEASVALADTVIAGLTSDARRG